MANFLISSTLFILLVIVLRKMFGNHVSKRLQYALWLLVAVKLLIFPIPWIESEISIFNITDKVELVVGENIQNASVTQVQMQEQSEEKSLSAVNETDNKAEKQQMQAAHQDTKTSTNILEQISLQLLLKICGLLGSCIVMFFWISTNGKFLCYLKKSRKTVECLEEGLPFGKKMQIYEVENLVSPCLYGKSIYVTPECLENEAKFRHVLAHEYAHYKQGDFLWSAVRALCLTVYWWHPFVWIAAHLSKQDCELACDEAALRLLGEEERLDYGKTLLSLIRVKGSTKDYFSVATTMTTEKNSLKQRIMAIAKKPKVVIPVCILVVLTVGFGFLATITGQQSEIVSGTYCMVGSEDGRVKPRLSIDAEEKSFVFSVDPLSSYLPVGSYTYHVQDGKLKGETEDGLYHITFEVDKETFKYLAEESKVPGVTDERLCAVLYDGAIFRLVPEENETIMPSYSKEEILSWFNGTGEPEIDGEAEPIWSEDEAIYYLPVKDENLSDLQAFLSDYFEQDEIDNLMETKIGNYAPFMEVNGVLYRGMGLIGNDNTSDISAEQLQQLAELNVWEGDVTLHLFVYNISRSERVIDSWAFDYPKYEEEYYFDYNLARKNGEIPAKSFVFDENAKFYVNETVGITESTEVNFEAFTDYIDSRSEASEEYGYEGAECLCQVKDGVITSITLQNPYPYISNLLTVPKDHYFYENFSVKDYYSLKSSYKTNLNHDKDNTELVEVYTGNVGDGDSGMVLVCSEDSAKEPFSIEAHTARAGWTNIYLVTIGGKDYIFELHFDSRDGYGECSYCLYYFGEQSERKLVAYVADGAAFDFGGEIEQESYDKWAEKMEQYLKDAVLLLSSQDGEIRVGPENDYDRYKRDALLEILQTGESG